jgi:hypothetical protein
MFIRLMTLFLFLVTPALAQTNNVTSTNHSIEIPNSSTGNFPGHTNQSPPTSQSVAEIRVDCIQSRRIICGKILKVLPEGLVVDSGYASLMRSPLNHSWLVPGTVTAQRAANLVEGNQPDSVCIGLVFLTDLPKRPTAKVYDYVNLSGYPTGQYSYVSVGDLRRNVRKFSTKLLASIRWKQDESEKQNAPLK